MCGRRSIQPQRRRARLSLSLVSVAAAADACLWSLSGTKTQGKVSAPQLRADDQWADAANSAWRCHLLTRPGLQGLSACQPLARRPQELLARPEGGYDAQRETLDAALCGTFAYVAAWNLRSRAVATCTLLVQAWSAVLHVRAAPGPAACAAKLGVATCLAAHALRVPAASWLDKRR